MPYALYYKEDGAKRAKRLTTVPDSMGQEAKSVWNVNWRNKIFRGEYRVKKVKA